MKMGQIIWQQAIHLRTKTLGAVRELRAGCGQLRKALLQDMNLDELSLTGSKEIERGQWKHVRWMSNKDV